jgi:hypothetical protein
MTNPVTLTTKIYQQNSLVDCIAVVVEAMPQKITISNAFNQWKIATGDDVYKAHKVLRKEIGETIYAVCCDAASRSTHLH